MTDNHITPDFIARLAAVQACYQRSQNNQVTIQELIEEYVHHRRDVRNTEGEIIGKPNSVLFKKILIGLEGRGAEIESILAGHKKAESTKISEALLTAILMCGITELLNHSAIDKALIINDYLNVCHSFYDKPQVSYVNGVLDSVAKLVRS